MTILNNIALEIISDGKGILAADESTTTMTKRLDSVGDHPHLKIGWRLEMYFFHLKV